MQACLLWKVELLVKPLLNISTCSTQLEKPSSSQKILKGLERRWLRKFVLTTLCSRMGTLCGTGEGTGGWDLAKLYSKMGRLSLSDMDLSMYEFQLIELLRKMKNSRPMA